MGALVRITVALPTYNSAHWLPGAIESVLAQRFDDFELLVLDNASTDDTAAIVARYDDPRLIYQVNERNLGFAGNVHLGHRMARGDYIIFLGADDRLRPDFLATYVAFMDAEPGCSMVHGRADWIDDAGRPMGSTGDGWARITPGPQAMLDTFAIGFCFTTMVIRRSALDASGPYDESWLELIDLWMLCRLCQVGTIGYIDRPLVDYRLHDGTMSMRLYRDNSVFRKQIAGIEEAFAWPSAVASGAASHLAAARMHVGRVAIDIVHVSRADGYGRYLANLAEIVREVPVLLLRPRTWLRIGFGLLPKPALRLLARLRGRRRFEPENATGGARPA